MQFSEMNHQTLDDLKQAIERALESGDLFSPEQLEQMQQRLQQMKAEQREKLIEQLVQKLEESGYVSFEGQPPDDPNARARRAADGPQVQFEVTDKAVDFLGFKTLRDLLGSLGNRASALTTRASSRRASMRAAEPKPTNSATC